MNVSGKILLAGIGLFVVGLIGSSQGGCDGLPNPGSTETGTLKMLITDKPFPFEFIAEASVTITRVEVRAAEGADDDEGEIDEADENDNEDDAEDDANENDNGDDDAEVTIREETRIKRDNAPDTKVKSKTKAELPRGAHARLSVVSVKPLPGACN